MHNISKQSVWRHSCPEEPSRFKKRRFVVSFPFGMFQWKCSFQECDIVTNTQVEGRTQFYTLSHCLFFFSSKHIWNRIWGWTNGTNLQCDEHRSWTGGGTARHMSVLGVPLVKLSWCYGLNEKWRRDWIVQMFWQQICTRKSLYSITLHTAKPLKKKKI